MLHKENMGFPLYGLREIKLLKYLQHPNIVKLEEIVTSKGCEADDPTTAKDEKSPGTPSPLGSLFLVFEYVEHDLAGLIDGKYKFSNAAIKSIMKQLFSALTYIHGKNVIHRDIKSSNLLITSKHQLKLADFGLARIVDRHAKLTNNVVTMWYKAPELILGATDYSYGVDVWSAACVLAELELSRPLFPGRTEVEQLQHIFNVVGTPNNSSYPDMKDLPNFRIMKQLQESEATLRTSWILRESTRSGKKVSEPVLALLERVLVPNPLSRLSARSVLENKYFLVHPQPPDDPTTLPPIQLPDLHEFTTKKQKRQERAAASGGGTTAVGESRSKGPCTGAATSSTAGGAWGAWQA